MAAPERQRSIERKILTSILWVGIGPMLFILILGFVSARWAQSVRTQKSLAALSQTTATGVRLALQGTLATSSNLSVDSTILEALEAGADMPEDLRSKLQKRLDRELLHTPGRPSRIRLLDAERNLIYSTDEEDEYETAIENEWPAVPGDEPRITSFSFAGEDSRRLVSDIVSIAVNENADEVIGYVMETRDLTRMMAYAFGRDPDDPSRQASAENRYQLVYFTGNGAGAVQISDSPETIIEPLDASETLVSRLRSDEPLSGAFYDSAYPIGNGETVSAFVGFHMMDVSPVSYAVVLQPASVAYALINRGAGISLLFCTLFIAVMCLNAYRNVHNNIVRPVSLLNEGAQIIGQGDLELKLKIDTNDEIEELASSFNKMALALKRNIGQLEDSEERYRSLVTAMRDGIFHADSNESITFINQAGLEIFGFDSLHRAVGTHLSSLFLNQEDLDRIRTDLERDGFIERSRTWMKRDDGREIIVEVSFNTVYDDDNRATGVEGTFRDVTMSVKLEEEARERSERIAAINQIANVINSSLEAGRLYESLVVEVKRLVDFDYAALALLDPAGETFSLRDLWPAHETSSARIFDSRDRSFCGAWVAHERAYLLIDDLSTSETPYSGQFPNDTRACLCIPLYATGRIIGTLNLGSTKAKSFSRHDIEVLEQMAPHVAVAIRNARLLENLQSSLEEVTRAREKLHEANEELKTLDEMKTNLLSNVSHELRTPLVSVMGYTDMIHNEKAGPINETQKEYLAISLRNVERLVTLIENLLDFSRLHQGAETLVFDTFDLVDCVKSSMQVLEPVANSRKIKLVLDAPEDAVIVEGDKGKLGQVFNNLLSNAVKFNDAGGSVTVTIEPNGDRINVSVADTGIGIPEEALDKVFTRFYQYDSSSTRKYGGTGIGLAIAQDIVRMHGSHITVASEAGVGSTFRFSLANPAAKDESRPATNLPAPKETEILAELVTADRALSSQIRYQLETEGMEIINAASTASAIALAQRHVPDCIIVDADNVDNVDKFLADILEHEKIRNVPVILITNDETFWRTHQQPSFARLKRDFRKSTLIGAVTAMLAAAQASAEGAPLGKKVLCVDDDQEILTFIERCLTQEGIEVDKVRSGEEAIRMTASGEYDTVLLDIAMPGLDGWETCRRIKSNPDTASIRVFMVTAKPVDMDEAAYRTAAPDGVLYKPFRPEDLLGLFRRLEPVRAS